MRKTAFLLLGGGEGGGLACVAYANQYRSCTSVLTGIAYGRDYKLLHDCHRTLVLVCRRFIFDLRFSLFLTFSTDYKSIIKNPMLQ
jgi:hypothetical protein